MERDPVQKIVISADCSDTWLMLDEAELLRLLEQVKRGERQATVYVAGQEFTLEYGRGPGDPETLVSIVPKPSLAATNKDSKGSSVQAGPEDVDFYEHKGAQYTLRFGVGSFGNNPALCSAIGEAHQAVSSRDTPVTRVTSSGSNVPN